MHTQFYIQSHNFIHIRIRRNCNWHSILFPVMVHQMWAQYIAQMFQKILRLWQCMSFSSMELLVSWLTSPNVNIYLNFNGPNEHLVNWSSATNPITTVTGMWIRSFAARRHCKWCLSNRWSPKSHKSNTYVSALLCSPMHTAHWKPANNGG